MMSADTIHVLSEETDLAALTGKENTKMDDIQFGKDFRGAADLHGESDGGRGV